MKPHGPITIDEVRAFLQKNNVDTVRAGAVDLDGVWRGKQFCIDYFLDSVAAKGSNIADVLLGWDVADELIEGLAYTSWETGYPDIKLMPDLSTLRLVPWEPRVAAVFCDMEAQDGKPLALSSRHILRAASGKAQDMGFLVKAACEYEFYLVDGTAEDLDANGWRNLKPLRGSGYCYSMLHRAGSDDILGQIRRGLQEAGIEVEATMSEHGPGQHELNLRYSDVVSAADDAVFAKYAVKAIAAKNGCMATFMAKPNAAWAGSSGHVHLSLSATDGTPAFANAADPGMLSDLGLSFIAGLKDLSRDLSALYLPNLNSYKRTNGRAWAASNSSWSVDNRTVSCRAVPSAGSAARVENRIPGADTNPYLVLAASLLSGLYGIEKGLNPGEPFTGNAYKATPEQAPPLAGSLEEAAWLLQESRIARDLFPADVIKHYGHMKRWELSRSNSAINDWELSRYLEII